MPVVKKILLVIKSAPYGAGRAAEGLRMATAMIAMDLLPEILFLDDGVYCLVKDQRPHAAGLVSFEERLKTISDLIGVYVASDSIAQRKLERKDLDQNYKAKSLALDEVAQLMSQNEATITF